MEALAADDPARIGPFRLVARLGRGGMGKVYLGRSDSTGRSVAVKTIHGELAVDREFRIRFSREVAAARRVRDEYIAEVVDADPDARIPWLATAYVPGISVEDAVRRFGPLPEDSVRVLGVCIGRAVAAIHAVDLVHRDLKPGNVLLTGSGPKVIDFGIARGQAEDGLTRTGMVSGSPPYMAPEQLMTGSFSSGSDVFALGAILHYAATAAGPYGRGGAQEQYARALAIGPELDTALPAPLREPISRCFNTEPTARPRAGELAAELETEPGERPLAGWLPSAVAQEILIQATDALNTESAAGAAPPAAPPQQFQPPPLVPPSVPQGPRPPQFQPAPPGPPPASMAGRGGPGPYGPPGPMPPGRSGPYSQPGPGPYSQPGPPRPAAPMPTMTRPPGSSGPGGPGGSIPSVPGGVPMQQPHPSFPPRPVARPPQTPPGPGPRPPMQTPPRPMPVAPRPGYPQAQPYYSGGMPPSNSSALTGLILALVGIIVPCALPVGLAFGIVGLNKGGPAGVGRGQAIAAVIVSAVMILFWVILFASIG
ncbi:MAG TPA: protein kinase [Actinocrinis sp.]|jgi:serine/threonine protein kinase